MATKPTGPSGLAGSPAQGAEATRRALLDAAVKLFSTHGFDGTTVKDIADAAGVNVSMISYHFDGKEGIYRSCLEGFGKERLQIAQGMLKAPSSHEEIRVRLDMFLEEMLTCHAEQADVCRMIHREFEMGLPVAGDLAKATFLKTFDLLVDFLDAAKRKSLLRADVDVHSAGSFLMGAVIHLARTDHVGKRFFNVTIRDPKHREQVRQQFLGIFLNGIKAE